MLPAMFIRRMLLKPKAGWPGWRVVAGCLLLSVQAVGIVAARFGDTRYFCWAPYDEITFYALSVRIGERELTPEEIRGRYRLGRAGRDNRSRAHVPAVIANYERTLGRDERAVVEYRYRVNGGEPRVWSWPAETDGEVAP